ncbi:MAG: hypothetical protein ACR2OR_13910 [Hyphomicrobiales bacterium]
MLLASRDARKGALKIHQNVELFAAKLERDKELAFTGNANRKYWLQLAKGAITLNNINMLERDGLAVADEKLLSVTANDNSEFLLFDIA